MAQPNLLAAERWQHRILLVFSPAADPRLSRQRDIVRAAAPGMNERDLRVIEVVGTTVTGAADTAAALRDRYRIAEDGFAAILIGKDGGEKLRATDAIPAARLFATIDAMPMRASEARR